MMRASYQVYGVSLRKVDAMSSTIDDVKRELPRVTVRMGALTYDAQVGGRKRQFATVWWMHEGHEMHSEWSWQAVAHAWRTGSALRYD